MNCKQENACGMNWLLMQLEQPDAYGNTRYCVIHFKQLIDVDATTIYAKRLLSFKPDLGNSSICQGEIRTASNDKSEVETEMLALLEHQMQETAVRKTKEQAAVAGLLMPYTASCNNDNNYKNSAEILLANAQACFRNIVSAVDFPAGSAAAVKTAYVLVQFYRGPHSIIHAIMPQTEICFVGDAALSSRLHAIIPDGKQQQMATVLFFHEQQDSVRAQLQSLKLKCFETAACQPNDVQRTINGNPWLLLQYCADALNVVHKIVRFSDTVWQAENKEQHSYAYLSDTAGIVFKAKIMRKSFDCQVLQQALHEIKCKCEIIEFPLPATALNDSDTAVKIEALVVSEEEEEKESLEEELEKESLEEELEKESLEEELEKESLEEEDERVLNKEEERMHENQQLMKVKKELFNVNEDAAASNDEQEEWPIVTQQNQAAAVIPIFANANKININDVDLTNESEINKLLNTLEKRMHEETEVISSSFHVINQARNIIEHRLNILSKLRQEHIKLMQFEN